MTARETSQSDRLMLLETLTYVTCTLSHKAPRAARTRSDRIAEIVQLTKTLIVFMVASQIAVLNKERLGLLIIGFNVMAVLIAVRILWATLPIAAARSPESKRKRKRKPKRKNDWS